MTDKPINSEEIRCKFCKNGFKAAYPKQKFCSQYCAQQSIFKKCFFNSVSPATRIEEHPRADCEGCNHPGCPCNMMHCKDCLRAIWIQGQFCVVNGNECIGVTNGA